MLLRLKEPEIFPVTLAEAKAHLRLDHGEEDTYLDTLIAAATGFAEQAMGRSLILQTWRRTWDKQKAYPAGLSITSNDICLVPLPYPPLCRVVAVNRIKENGKKFPLRRFRVETKHQVPHLVFADVPESVEIDYETGYGDQPASIPAAIRYAILMKVADFYERRSSSGTLPGNGAIGEILASYRVTRLA